LIPTGESARFYVPFRSTLRLEMLSLETLRASLEANSARPLLADPSTPHPATPAIRAPATTNPNRPSQDAVPARPSDRYRRSFVSPSSSARASSYPYSL